MRCRFLLGATLTTALMVSCAAVAANDEKSTDYLPPWNPTPEGGVAFSKTTIAEVTRTSQNCTSDGQ